MNLIIRQLTGHIALILEWLGLILNLLTVYLIKRQGFQTVDMWLALIITSSDIIVIILKLGQWIFLQITSQFDIFSDIQFGQWDLITASFFSTASILGVGILAVLRWWAIVKSRPVIFKHWIISFLGLQAVIAILLINVALRKDFILMPAGRYFFPNAHSDNFLTQLCIFILILWCTFSILVVNISYTLLTQKYLNCLKLTPGYFDYNANNLAQYQSWSKFKMISKMLGLLFIYNLAMIPPVTVMIIEVSTHQIRHEISDCLFGLACLLLTFVNPLTLICLHQDTSQDLVQLWYNLFHSPQSSKNQLSSCGDSQ